MKRSVMAALVIVMVALTAPALGQGQPPGQGVVPANLAKPATAGAAPTTRPAPFYVVVEGAHYEDASPFQSLTVLCPPGHKAFGAGFSAVVREPPATPSRSANATPTKPTAPSYRESGLNSVRSVPDLAGGGWRIEGVSPEAIRTRQPWRLFERVVCVQVAP